MKKYDANKITIQNSADMIVRADKIKLNHMKIKDQVTDLERRAQKLAEKIRNE